MQLIKFGETVAAKCEIPLTSVQSSDGRTRITAATLPNASITVKIKRAGVGTAVSGTGAFTTADDSGAPSVRGYVPSVGDQVLGVNTFVFTGASMEPREVPVCFVAFDPFDTVRMGLTGIRPDAVLVGQAISGTLTASSFTTNLTIPSGALAGEAHLRFLGNITAALAGQVQKITSYSGGLVAFSAPFTTAPANLDQFVIVNG